MKSYQGSFPFGTPDIASTHKDRVFLAVMPPLEIAAYILSLAQQFCVDFGLAWKLLRQDRLHCSLFCFPLRKGVPDELVNLISKAVSRIVAAPFDVTFSVAESFVHKPRNHPLVLLGEEDEVFGMRNFQRLLNIFLIDAGLTRSLDTSFVPHVTTLYDNRVISRTPIAPVTWTVNEFLLIHSLVGKTEYRLLGRWPLTGAPVAKSPVIQFPGTPSERSLEVVASWPCLAKAA